MTGKLSALVPGTSLTGLGIRRGSINWLHGFGLLLVAALVLVLVSGCTGSDSTPSAQDQLCTNLSNLQDSVQSLLTVKKDEDFTTFKNEWNQVKTDFNSVKTSAREVATPHVDPITTSFNALVTAVQGALTASSVSAAITSIQTAAKNFADSMSAAVSDLKCSS
jgi:ABC-type glycerol-3-phosphate transport system substrate-binding protein